MHRIIRAATLGFATIALGACSGGGGLFRETNGDITITDVTTGQVITSTLSQPFIDGTSSFTISVGEQYFSGPYTATMVKWNNGFDIPCYTAVPVPNTTNTEFILNSTNANAPGVTTPNPCVTNFQDEETVQISDTKGHSVFLYFTY